MSAFVYIQITDIPRPLTDTAARRIDGDTHAALIAFIGCPLVGVESADEVEFPFPRAIEIRESLVSWLVHWGICFRVVM
ncbi:hypothetical protein [Caballeronia sp. dw_19]|uniref:hypothetical protein n=1 Tax=Caballeronia sp. dw_19 TaxID=2719791 RepID=UPI001BD08C6A|nr:hypothetical protein [Caballeronia sp. dw_19]